MGFGFVDSYCIWWEEDGGEEKRGGGGGRGRREGKGSGAEDGRSEESNVRMWSGNRGVFCRETAANWRVSSESIDTGGGTAHEGLGASILHYRAAAQPSTPTYRTTLPPHGEESVYTMYTAASTAHRRCLWTESSKAARSCTP